MQYLSIRGVVSYSPLHNEPALRSPGHWRKEETPQVRLSWLEEDVKILQACALVVSCSVLPITFSQPCCRTVYSSQCIHVTSTGIEIASLQLQYV